MNAAERLREIEKELQLLGEVASILTQQSELLKVRHWLTTALASCLTTYTRRPADIVLCCR